MGKLVESLAPNLHNQHHHRVLHARVYAVVDDRDHVINKARAIPVIEAIIEKCSPGLLLDGYFGELADRLMQRGIIVHYPVLRCFAPHFYLTNNRFCMMYAS